MATMFEPSTLNGLALPNRFMRSATWEGLATPEGAVTSDLTSAMTTLAAGGVGLIISGHAYVDRVGQASPRQLGIYSDELVPGLKEMVSAVHGAGGRIVAQLAHAGCFAPAELSGLEPWAVSAEVDLVEGQHHTMTLEDIQITVKAFATAAERAVAAGFDGVQIHSAHGYLLNQFLSPLFNRRPDEYGGEVANRVRIHLQVLKAVRSAVGENYPVMMKFNCSDFVEGGLELEDALAAAATLEKAGIDAIELSGGLLRASMMGPSPSRAGINKPSKEAYHQTEARAFRAKLNLPLVLVGGLRSFEVAENMVSEGIADYIAMSRPLIREPDLIARWQAGDRRPAECKSDNLCFSPGMVGDGVYCVTARKEKEKRGN
jgi:2,4-dienoyl-CoA reductase-like NADH-dependent reductase (Old Yellow Enzyme family)